MKSFPSSTLTVYVLVSFGMNTAFSEEWVNDNIKSGVRGNVNVVPSAKVNVTLFASLVSTDLKKVSPFLPASPTATTLRDVQLAPLSVESSHIFVDSLMRTCGAMAFIPSACTFWSSTSSHSPPIVQ